MGNEAFDDGENTQSKPWQYSREYIDQLRDMADIVGIIGQHVNLKHAGNDRWMGICPFHNDHAPSFSVFKTGFYCFGCQISGDVIKFLMSHDGLSFGEAIRYLQIATGISPPSPLEMMMGSWNISAAKEDPEDSVEHMLWKIANQCHNTLKMGWEIPVVYERVMMIFKAVDEALENGNEETIKSVKDRLSRLLNWDRISREEAIDNAG